MLYECVNRPSSNDMRSEQAKREKCAPLEWSGTATRLGKAVIHHISIEWIVEQRLRTVGQLQEFEDELGPSDGNKASDKLQVVWLSSVLVK